MSEKEKGKGYAGNSGTSTANQELIVNLSGWTKAPEYYRFSFINDQDCTVKVNGNTIPLRAGQGFESGKDDASIKSFILVTANVSFSFVGAY
jgi:hypothetical protein